MQRSPAVADHQDRDAGNPDFSFPNRSVSEDEPILVIILKHTDRTKIYTRLEPPIKNDLLDWLLLGLIYERHSRQDT